MIRPGTELRAQAITSFSEVPLPVRILKEQNEVIPVFNENLWNGLVEKLVVKTRDDVTEVFKDGTETKAE